MSRWLWAAAAGAGLGFAVWWSGWFGSSLEPQPSAAQGAATAIPTPSVPRAEPEQSRAIPPTKAVSAVATPLKETWRAFDRSAKESLRLVRHRAAVSGALVDLVATSRLIIRCVSNSPRPDYYEQAGVKLSDKQRELLLELIAQCEGGELSRPGPIRDLSGFTGDPDRLIAAAGASSISNPAEQDQILQFARQTGSAELLEAVSHATIGDQTLARWGLAPAPGIPATFDRDVALIVIRTRACEARGDCAGAATLSPMCSVVNMCVDDLREWGPRRVYGAKEDRAMLPSLMQMRNVPTEAIRARWGEVERVVAARLF